MSDELWLKELAQMKRDQDAESEDRLDDRWDRLSAGTLSPEEEAELKALAGESPEAAEAYEAFRPLGVDFQAGVVQEIQKQGFAPAADPPPAKVLPFRQRNLTRIVWSTAAAVAAALLFFVVRGPSYPPLPAYAMAPVVGDQRFRGEAEPSAGLPVFSPGSLLILRAAPEHRDTDPVKAQAYAAQGADFFLLDAEPSVDNNAVQLRGTLGQEISLQPGSWTIWIVVSRPGRSPTVSELKSALQAGAHDDWQAACSNRAPALNRQDQWQVVCANLRVEDRPTS